MIRNDTQNFFQQNYFLLHIVATRDGFRLKFKLPQVVSKPDSTAATIYVLLPYKLVIGQSQFWV